MACDACIAPHCINAMSRCAENVSCDGGEAMRCEAGCGSCMACFDSNDRSCHGCSCCIGCLPVAAKCSLMQQQQPAEHARFIFVGLYNHRRYYNERSVAHAVVDISLTPDTDFRREELPQSWTAELYDQFRDISRLEVTQRQVYPDGEQFIYEIRLADLETLHLDVRLYRSRVTLLHIVNAVQSEHMKLEFV